MPQSHPSRNLFCRSSFTESDMQEINEACGDTNAQVLRHLGGQDSTLAVVQEGPIGDARQAARSFPHQ